MLRLLGQAAPLPGEIFNTLDGLVNLLAEGESVTLIVSELDRLLELTTEYFREDDIAVIHEDNGRNGRQVAIHRRIIDYIANLRSQANRLDRTPLLPELRFLDYWLSAHISERSSPYTKSVRLGI